MTTSLAETDEALVRAAERQLTKQFDSDHHFVSAAVRTADGDVFTALNIKAEMGRASVCAEPIAIGNAISQGATGLETVVAVRKSRTDANGETFVIPPCGVCLELISDFGPDARVIVPDDEEGLEKVPVHSLIPSKPYSY